MDEFKDQSEGFDGDADICYLWAQQCQRTCYQTLEKSAQLFLANLKFIDILLAVTAFYYQSKMIAQIFRTKCLIIFSELATFLDPPVFHLSTRRFGDAWLITNARIKSYQKLSDYHAILILLLEEFGLHRIIRMEEEIWWWCILLHDYYILIQRNLKNNS